MGTDESARPDSIQYGQGVTVPVEGCPTVGIFAMLYAETKVNISETHSTASRPLRHSPLDQVE